MLFAAMAALALQAGDAAPCPNWKGWDADHQRDICGPAIGAPRGADLSTFEARWRQAIVSIKEAEYVHYCGLRSQQWTIAVRTRVEGEMANDALYRRLTAVQHRSLNSLRAGIEREAVHNMMGGAMPCRDLVGWQHLTVLDRLAYPVFGGLEPSSAFA